MNPNPVSTASELIGRREAIRRAALLIGVTLTPALLDQALRAQTTAAKGGAHLNSRQMETLAPLVERILPRTDTPGAQDVGVPAFVDRLYGEFLPPGEKTMFAAGLAEVEAIATKLHQRNFAALPPGQQDALLQEMARAAQTLERTFFHQIREFTLLGYFTSEPVQKNVLHYDPIPGRLDACIPLSEVGDRAWAR